ncbi:MAG: exodeoxyribonuclease VII large subunit [Chloroflexi bacterium]|nr:exodeoxyribonuclease VII large subunit [Chloroflexota bacterium]
MADSALPLPRKVLRVGELTRYLKYVLEQDELLASLSLEGEIADLSRSPSGHVYFVLKDSSSQVACVLFRREALQQMDAVRQMHKGILVVVHGFLTVYEPRGTFQIYVERVVPRGHGAQFRRFEELKAKLEGEGLFAAERKRDLPPFPRRLALITSPGSQAYHDVLHRLGAQFPFVRVIEVGVSVQGDGAADEMAMAIDIVNRLTDADLILLVRGGGAPEELAAFNEERLARAIFASRVPVVTGVGHETDVTIADFVADRRAATPSLAAAVAVPDAGALLQQAGQLHARLRQVMTLRLRLDRRRWVEANRALLRANPEHRLRRQRQRADELRRSLHRAMSLHLRAKRARYAALKAQLDALDPLAILSRGYAVLTDAETGEVVARMDQATPARRLLARVSDGQFPVRVEES